MGLLRPLVLGTILATSLTAYMLYEPLPEDFTEERTRLQILFATTKVVNAMSHIGVMLGYGTFYDMQTWIYEDLAERLRQHHQANPNIETREDMFNGVRVKMYKPKTFRDGGPGLIYTHGGGYAAFSADHSDELSEQMALSLNALVFSIDYRRPPAHLYPTAHDDCLAAARYVMTNAKDFNVDPARIAILGDSAGGNLAAYVTLKLRDEKLSPRLQVLIYPHTQSIDFKTPSHQVNKKIISARTMAAFYICYVTGGFPRPEMLDDVIEGKHISSTAREKFKNDIKHESIIREFPIEGYQTPSYPASSKSKYPELEKAAVDTTFSLALSDDLRGLPETYVMTCQLDPLRDDGILLANRLRKSGVKVTHVNYKEAFHSLFSHLFGKYRKETMEFVKKTL